MFMLTRLDLSNNRLSSLTANCLLPLRKAKILEFAHNAITRVDELLGEFLNLVRMCRNYVVRIGEAVTPRKMAYKWMHSYPLIYSADLV